MRAVTDEGTTEVHGFIYQHTHTPLLRISSEQQRMRFCIANIAGIHNVALQPAIRAELIARHCIGCHV